MKAMEPLSRAQKNDIEKVTRNSKKGCMREISLFSVKKTKLNRESISERVKFREGGNRTRRFSVKFPQIPQVPSYLKVV